MAKVSLNVSVSTEQKARGAPALILLTATAALGQFAGNIYAPSLPSVARSFEVSAASAQMSIAVFFAAFAVCQLLFGPISDRHGRRPVLLMGIAIYLLGTALCALAPTFSLLIAGRVVQAAGAAAAIVMSRAITRDSFDGPDLTRAMATITIVFALVPGLTPLLGGVLEELAGWRATFVAVAVVGAGVLAAVLRSLDETLKARTPRLEFGATLGHYRDILRDRVFLSYTLAAGAVMGSLAAFFAGSPALLIEIMGLSPLEYGIYPAISVVGFMIGGLATRKLANRLTPRQLAGAGLVLLLLGAVLLFSLAWLGMLSRIGVAGAMVVHITGLGLFLPTAISAALQRYPARAGAAASLQGFLQMSGAALGALLVSLLQSEVPTLAFPATMLVFTALAALALTALPRSTQQ